MFSVLVLLSLIFLCISIYLLIKAFSNLDNFHKNLKNYYKQTNETDISDIEFNDYILKELIKTTTINQINNDSKIYHRFVCNKYMIITFLTLCILLIPFGIDYGLQNTKQKIQKVQVDSTFNINIISEHNNINLDSLINK